VSQSKTFKTEIHIRLGVLIIANTMPYLSPPTSCNFCIY